jgi:hypothetical protein
MGVNDCPHVTNPRWQSSLRSAETARQPRVIRVEVCYRFLCCSSLPFVYYSPANRSLYSNNLGAGYDHRRPLPLYTYRLPCLILVLSFSRNLKTNRRSFALRVRDKRGNPKDILLWSSRRFGPSVNLYPSGLPDQLFILVSPSRGSGPCTDMTWYAPSLLISYRRFIAIQNAFVADGEARSSVSLSQARLREADEVR